MTCNEVTDKFAILMTARNVKTKMLLSIKTPLENVQKNLAMRLKFISGKTLTDQTWL